MGASLRTMTGRFPRPWTSDHAHWSMLRPLNPLIVRATVVAVAACILGACSSSATLSDGATLAKAGQAAALQMQQNVTLSQTTVTNFQRAIAFNDGFNNAIGNSASNAVLSDIAAIQKGLVPYGKMLGSLASTYAALGTLTGYDAVGSFNASIDSLAADVTSLGKALNEPINLPSTVSSGVKTVGGFIIGGVQAGDVKDASAKIETILDRIIALLSAPGTRQKLVLAQGEVTGLIDQAAATLFLQGVFTYGPVLDTLGSPFGLKSTTESDAAVNGNPAVKRGVNAVVVGMVKEQVDGAAASYDASLAALRALRDQHAKLLVGQPVNLDAIISAIGQLQTIAASLTSSKGK